MKINHISVSRKKLFDQCPQAYKFRYELCLPAPNPQPFYFLYGSLVHKIAELYVENRGKTPIGEICKDIVRGKIELEEGKKCPPIPSDYQRKLQKHLRAIQNLTEKIGTDGEVEHRFHYDLDGHGHCVTGFLDRLILKNGKAFIIDYKTTKKGKWRVNRETVKHDIQLRMYARVVQREFDLAAANIRAALFYLEGEELVACQYSDDSLARVEKELLDSYLLIEIADADRVWGRVGWQCKMCDYNTVCPFYKPNQEQATAGWDGSMEDIA